MDRSSRLHNKIPNQPPPAPPRHHLRSRVRKCANLIPEPGPLDLLHRGELHPGRPSPVQEGVHGLRPRPNLRLSPDLQQHPLIHRPRALVLGPEKRARSAIRLLRPQWLLHHSSLLRPPPRGDRILLPRLRRHWQ